MIEVPSRRFPRNPHNLVLRSTAHDLTDQRFGRLVALYPERHAALGWVCQCDCGNQSWVRPEALRMKRVVSCGCHKAEQLRKPKPTHGMSKTKTYSSWVSMKQRCGNPNNTDWHHYGGRGVKVCDRWLNSFEAFLEDMGEAPKGTSIDRIDNEGNYEPSNCRWATQMEQTNNQRSNIVLEVGGKAQNIAQWAKEVGVKKSLIRNRIRLLNWSAEDAVNTPAGVRRRA